MLRRKAAERFPETIRPRLTEDPTKVDRSATYAVRYIAKNTVAAGRAKKAEIQFAYAIGVASPVSVNMNTCGTGTVSDETFAGCHIGTD